MGMVIDGEEIETIETAYGDVWFVRGKHGEKVPMYSDRWCEHAAIAAFIRGEYGSLLADEIKFMKEAIGNEWK